MSTTLKHSDSLALLATLEQIDRHQSEIDRLDAVNGLTHAEREEVFHVIQVRRSKIDQLHADIVKIMTALALVMMIGCSSGTYPNMTHNHNKTRTDYYGNRYKWKGLHKQYEHRTYGMEARTF